MRSIWWRALPLFLCGLCGLAALILTAPTEAPVTVTANLLQMIGNGLGAAYLFVATSAFAATEPARRGWRRLALAMGANCLGFVIYGAMEMAGGVDLFPSWADVFWIATYPLALWAILDLARLYRSSGLPLAKSRIAWPLAGLLLVAVGVVLLVPLWQSHDLPVWQRAILLLYPVCDVFLITAATYMAELMSGFGRGALAWPWVAILGGSMIMAFTDLTYALLNLHDLYQTGNPVDAGWVLSGVLMGFGGFLQWRIMTRDLGREEVA